MMGPAVLIPLLLFALMALVIPASHFAAARVLRVRGLTFFGLRPASEYFSAHIGKRLVIRAAGPIAVWSSIALFAAWGIWLTGRPEPSLQVLVIPGRAAEVAGMQSGDTVVAVAGEPVDSFDEFRSRASRQSGQPIELEVDRHGRRVVVRPVPDKLGKIGVLRLLETKPVTFLDSLVYGSSHLHRILSALRAGFRGRYSVELSGPIERVIRPRNSDRQSGAGDYLLVTATAASVCFPSMVMIDALIAYVVWRRRNKRGAVEVPRGGECTRLTRAAPE